MRKPVPLKLPANSNINTPPKRDQKRAAPAEVIKAPSVKTVSSKQNQPKVKLPRTKMAAAEASSVEKETTKEKENEFLCKWSQLMLDYGMNMYLEPLSNDEKEDLAKLVLEFKQQQKKSAS